MPSPWLSENFPRKAPYFPQIGDILMVFKKGYEKYMEFVELRNTYKVNKRDLLWMKRKSLEDGTLVRNIINFFWQLWKCQNQVFDSFQIGWNSFFAIFVLQIKRYFLKILFSNFSIKVKVSKILFEIRPPRLCVVKVEVLEQSTLQPTNEQFTIKYHDMDDVVDFLVLYQYYNR